jgi:hypothetical protein
VSTTHRQQLRARRRIARALIWRSTWLARLDAAIELVDAAGIAALTAPEVDDGAVVHADGSVTRSIVGQRHVAVIEGRRQ